ncbi:hypothetical protein SAMN02744775_04263 [Enterobacter sp. CC120223-11]|nr:hypothetical protein SAMN02744775_04263 [Enterobacter sp. CC120223-11]
MQVIKIKGSAQTDQNVAIPTTTSLREKYVIPLQNSPERVSFLPIAPGVDFATAVTMRRLATANGVTPAYLLVPEVSALLYYMPDLRHYMLFSTFWNTGCE